MILFSGAATALITPFKDGKIDYVRMGRLIEWQIAQGIDALVVCGTTGEASTMSYRERMRTIEFCVDHVDGRLPVIAGTGSNSTENALALSRDAERAGADGLLLVTPYYNKASQAGLIRHFQVIAGPCSVEGKNLIKIARRVKAAGATMLRSEQAEVIETVRSGVCGIFRGEHSLHS